MSQKVRSEGGGNDRGHRMHIKQAIGLEHLRNQLTGKHGTGIEKEETKLHISLMSALCEDNGKHSQADVPRFNNNCGTSRFEVGAV